SHPVCLDCSRCCSLQSSALCFRFFFFFSSRRRHTRSKRDWSSDVCSSDLFPLSVQCNAHIIIIPLDRRVWFRYCHFCPYYFIIPVKQGSRYFFCQMLDQIHRRPFDDFFDHFISFAVMHSLLQIVTLS